MIFITAKFRVLPERITVPAGRIRIVARNTGRLTHNVAVVQFDRDGGTPPNAQGANRDRTPQGRRRMAPSRRPEIELTQTK